jgi:acetyl-CoA carboxylase biotin carboxyl carrier protein
VGLTYQEVTEILKVIDASECDEVVVELDGTRLVVRRTVSDSSRQDGAPPPIMPTTAPIPSSIDRAPLSEVKAVGRVSVAAESENVPPGLLDVRAPMVGTFYRRPSPQEPVFVDVGQAVAKGQPLCLIEVMKLFTTVEATEAGTIETVLADDGALVEFDQLLFRIRRT